MLCCIDDMLAGPAASISHLQDDRAAAIFFSLTSVQMRIKVMDELARVTLAGNRKLLTDWKDVARGTRELSDMRNALAHGVPSMKPKLDGGSSPAIGRSAPHLVLRREDHWTFERIQDALESFGRLSVEIYSLSSAIDDR